MKLFQKIIVAVSRHPKLLINDRIRRCLGDYCFYRNEIDTAILLYSKTVQIDDSVRHERLGRLYEIVGEEKRMSYHLKIAARFGNQDALDYFVNYFLKKDPGKVAKFARELTQAGDKDAKCLLICSLEAMNRYDDELIRLLQKEAEQGDRLAQFDLGCCYLDGKGVTQDYAKAYLWTLLAAFQEHPIAQNNIGYMYKKGICVEQNHEQAILWTLRAASNGSALSRESILEELSSTDPVRRQQMMQSLSYKNLCHIIRPNVYGNTRPETTF